MYIKAREIKGAREGILRDNESNTALPQLSTAGENVRFLPSLRENPF